MAVKKGRERPRYCVAGPGYGSRTVHRRAHATRADASVDRHTYKMIIELLLTKLYPSFHLLPPPFLSLAHLPSLPPPPPPIIIILTSRRSMRHNNLLRYYGLGLDMDRKEILVVTEYMGGGDLASLLFNSSTPVPWTLKLRVACDVLEGIVFLHSNDVVHRDIKPENVLVDDNWRCAVSDYGLARKVSHGEAMTCCGTYATMAPEVIWGEPYDQRADVFSYGMLLWEIIYRQHSSEEGFLARHPRTKFKLDLDALKEGAPPGTPESLVILATQCCCEEPDYRQSSAEALEWLMDLLREVEAAEGPAGERSAWPSAAVLKAEAAAKEASLKAAAAAAAAAADAAAAAAAASEEDADAGAADVSGVVESEQ